MTVIEARDVPEATSGGKGGTRNERRGWLRNLQIMREVK